VITATPNANSDAFTLFSEKSQVEGPYSVIRGVSDAHSRACPTSSSYAYGP
jgi:hypothetical protein